MSETARFFKNAAYNVINGAASALFAIVLPYFFVRQFTEDEFGVWVLVLQVAAYATYLNFGLQVAVGRYVTEAVELSDDVLAAGIVAAALQILTGLAGTGLLVIVGVAAAFPDIFHEVPRTLIMPARIMLLWVGFAVALGLPATAFLGAFAGLQRNEIPAWISAGGKTVLVACLVAAAAFTHDLVIVGVTYFAINTATYLVQYAAYRRVCGHWKTRFVEIRPAQIRELIDYCSSLVVWVLAMLLINGMDTTIVGLFDFPDVAAYGVAISIASFFGGLMQAVLSPLIQIFTKLHIRQDQEGLMKLLYLSSFGATLFMLIAACVAVAIAGPAFTLWVGPQIAGKAILLFDILVFATVIRYSALPYTNYLIATGQQKKVILSPFIEGITNFCFSIIAVRIIGATGVAAGTVFGGIIAVALNQFYNFPRTAHSGFRIADMVKANWLAPFLFALPAFAVLSLRLLHVLPSVIGSFLVMAVGAICMIAGAWYVHSQKQLDPPPEDTAANVMPRPDMPPT